MSKNHIIELKRLFQWYGVVLTSLSIVCLLLFGILSFLPEAQSTFYKNSLIQAVKDQKFYIFIIVGFIAQMIDSSLGMAYGVSSSTFLIAMGVPPKMVSAGINISEIVNNAVSALSHFKMGNIDRVLFISLIIPGSVGAFLGASLLVSFDGSRIKPFISIYLIIMGIYIISKAINRDKKETEKINKKFKGTGVIAFIGGLVSALTGGGRGPVVTSTLIGTGEHPRKVIGSVNSAKYIIVLIASVIFILKLDNLIDILVYIIGLIIGGVTAAPLGAFIAKHIPVKPAILLVGSVIILLSSYTLYKTFMGA